MEQMETQQLILTTKDELRNLLREELQISIDQSKGLDGDDQILKRKDIAEMFGISLVTVHAWMKIGHLPYHRLGGKTYFKKAEVIEALRKIKIRRK